MFDISERTIFVTLAGSQAHGTARDGSDVDLRGVCVAPLELRVSLFQTFEQSEAPLVGTSYDAVLSRLRAHPTAWRGLDQRTETVVFELAKFDASPPNAKKLGYRFDFADLIKYSSDFFLSSFALITG